MSDHSGAVAGKGLDGMDLVKGATRVAIIGGVVTAVAVGILIGLAVGVAPASKPDASLSEKAVEQRILKVGTVAFQDNKNREPRTGEQVVTAQCASCHGSGAMGSPKIGDKGAWAPRLGAGFAGLVKSAIGGKGAMPPQGGGAATDFEIARAVVFMANGGGANFPEPPKPAEPADAAAKK